MVVAMVLALTGMAYAAERVAVKSNIANIRAFPGTKADTIWQVEKYHPLIVLSKKGKWYRIKDLDGEIGWIHGSLVDKTATVVVKVKIANVRNGPGVNNDLVFPAGKGTPFKVLKKKGRWLKVQHADGDIGWIFRSLVW